MQSDSDEHPMTNNTTQRSIRIPDAAVEAAAKWLHDNDCRSAVHSGHPADFECYDWLDEAKELLEAAAPHMLGDAPAEIRDWKEYGPEEAWAVLEASHARLGRYRPTQ